MAPGTVEASLNLDSRILEHKPVKRGKGRPPKNASTFDAFDIVAEQTLRVSIRRCIFNIVCCSCRPNVFQV